MWMRTAKVALLAGVLLAAILFLAQGLGARSEQQEAWAKLAVPSSPEVQRAVADLNEELRASWQMRGLAPAGDADWRTVCRRLSLALVGAGVSLEDLRMLESVPESERTGIFLERLLADRRFADYWAARLGRAFVGNEEGAFLVFRSRRFVNWLADQLEQNRPYDELLGDLIAAEGFWTDRPAVNFVTATSDPNNDNQPDPMKLAGRTSRVVLGVRIDCLQCHDDFLGNVTLGDASDPRPGEQRDFHQLAAFYAPAKVSILQGVVDRPADYEYQFLESGTVEVVAPAVPFLQELLPEQGSHRQRLAAWATHPVNAPAVRAAVNRMWALMFGRPLTEHVDSIPLHGALPVGMQRLADAFVEVDFDIRQLVRIIARTDAFTRDSRADFEVTELHEDAWAVFPLVPLRPEQVAGCIIQASRVATIDHDSHILVQLQTFGELTDFVRRYGDTGEDNFVQDNVTTTQRLLVMNGKLVRERIEQNPVLNASTHIDMFASTDIAALEAIYLAVLNRLPTDVERVHFLQRLGGTAPRRQAIEDIYWTLLNSTELAWNH